MDLSYLATPAVAWLTAGCLKFLVNSIRMRAFAFELIGTGGWPSTHCTVSASMAAAIGLKEGLSHPAFGVAVTLVLIVVMDATGLRRQMAKHAAALNELAAQRHRPRSLRERLGHNYFEASAGLALGAIVASVVQSLAVAP